MKADQCSRILALLAGAGGNWVPLPEILDLKISQYSSRIFELRRKGFIIENRSEYVDGRRHSWFRLAGGRCAAFAVQAGAPAETAAAS